MRKHLRSLPSLTWIVDYAPTPSDIFWENLSIPRPCWYLNAVLINFALGIILFFLTTPAVSLLLIKIVIIFILFFLLNFFIFS